MHTRSALYHQLRTHTRKVVEIFISRIRSIPLSQRKKIPLASFDRGKMEYSTFYIIFELTRIQFSLPFNIEREIPQS